VWILKVKVKLYATLRQYAPNGTEIGEVFEVDLPSCKVCDLIDSFGFEHEQAKIVIVNDKRIFDLNHELNEGDLIVIFPPIGGG
jgi:molybdopterin converting factor small subunit